jgi:putative membrane protein
MRQAAGIFVLCLGMSVVGCQHSGGTASSGDVSGGRSAQIGTSKATMADTQFFNDAAAGGTYEVQSSQMALQKSQSAGVKGLAQHMIDDHTKANTELLALARSKDVTVTPAPNQMQQDMLNRLQGLSGSSFDQEYLRQQQTAHQDTISKFQAATRNTSQPVAAWASKTLPTLQQHLAMVNQQMGGDRNGAGTMR